MTKLPSSFSLNLKWKFVTAVVLAVLVVSASQNIFFYRLDTGVFTQNLESKIGVLGRVLADNSTSAVQFQSRDDALEVLGSLASEPAVLGAYLFTREGLLAEYVAEGEQANIPKDVEFEAALLRDQNGLTVREPVVLGGETIGVLLISADFRELEARNAFRLIVWPAVLIGGVLLAVAISLLSQRLFVTPIHELADLSERIAADGSYALRAHKTSDDELGTLVDSFNAMLGAIENRDLEISEQAEDLRRTNAALAESRDLLEARVRERTEELRASEGRFRALLESAPDAILISKSDGSIELVNAQAERLFGYEAEELIGQSVEVLLPPAVQGRHVVHRQAYVAKPEVRNMGAGLELMAVSKDGTEIPVDVSLSPIETEDGLRIAAAVRDVTLQRRSKRQMQGMMEELRQSNSELENKSRELETQQEELQQTNEELEEQRGALEEEKRKLELLMAELEVSQAAFEEKAREAELANRYKSEFLANVSHELRTPLNSIMILSQVLAENSTGNLDGEQIKNAHTIHASGRDLLDLISDILDLSKIEAGRLDLNLSGVEPRQVAAAIERTFSLQMQQRGLRFDVTVDEDVPASISTDRVRFEQIVKNLVSNALKFTERGSVEVRFSLQADAHDEEFLLVDVADTGIGIEPSLHDAVFQAFRQLDSSLSRRYSGTGLGLSISENLARKLGGRVTLESEPNRGSTFSLRLPLAHRDVPEVAPMHEEEGPRARTGRRIDDDRAAIAAEDRPVLIIEDDASFAQILIDKCRAANLKCLHAPDGIEGLELARSYRPGAVILDLRLPGVHGIKVLDGLKADPKTRHIPVHVLSAEDRGEEVLELGATAFLAKPVPLHDLDRVVADIERVTARQTKNVLLIDHEASQREAIREMLDDHTIRVSAAQSKDEARRMMQELHYDCVIVDIALGGDDPNQLRDLFEGDGPPVIVYTGKDMDRAEVRKVSSFSDAIVVKGKNSQNRLLDEVTLFLHSIDAQRMATGRRRRARTALADENVLTGKSVLVVDDDIRNIYSLRQVLLSKGLEVTQAHTGKEALEALDASPGIDLVLMDVMMPEMDGIEAIERLRDDPRFRDLPIIALTAKAMKQDREDCLQAGANDYLAKPIDADKLLSLIRIWLTR